jgi:hypothetical protein
MCRVFVALLGLLYLSAAAHAQEPLPQDPKPQAPPPAHKFFDTANIALTGVEVTALLADGIYTQRMNTVPGAYEADPIARPFVDRGWPGQIVGGALFVSAEVGLRYWLHRKNHHRMERWLPMVLTAYGTIGAIHNAHALHDYNKWLVSVGFKPTSSPRR